MRRTYPRGAALASIAVMGIAVPSALAAQSLFNSKPLPQKQFAVLAQPVGRSDWKLLVLEQIKRQPRCWTERNDGLIDPSLNRFNFSGICSRYLDSNGYSLRTGGEDLGTRFRLRVQQAGASLTLQAVDPNQGAPITIGRADIPRRDRNGFVSLALDPGWKLERRVYKGRTLSHVYFAHQTPVNRLLALAERNDSHSGFARLGAPVPPAPPLAIGSLQRNRVASAGPIRLQVIPYAR